MNEIRKWYVVFIGHTRFSLFVPNSGAWRASNGGRFSSSDEYKSYLFSEKRLELRTSVFLEHTVPTLQRAAEGFEVTHIVSYSESLPAKYKRKLEEIESNYAIIQLDERPDGDNGFGSPSRVASELGIDGVFGRYRLDDDDILSTDYFRLMNKYIKPEFVGMAVSLPLGIEAVLDEGQFFNLREAHVPMNSMGLLYVCSRAASGHIAGPKGGPHDKSDRYDPVIIDSQGYGYLRCIHSGQDNAMRYLDESKMESLLGGMAKFPPATDFPRLRNSFPTVAKLLEEAVRVEDMPVRQNLNENLFLELEVPSPNLSLLIDGKAIPTNGHPALVSFTIVDNLGHLVPRNQQITGIGLSKNPAIGHFVYLSAEESRISSLVSLHLANGYKFKAFKIVGLGNHTSAFQINRLKLLHSGHSAKIVSASRFEEIEDTIPYPLAQRLRDVAYRNRHKIATKIKNTFDNERIRRIVSKLESPRRSLMR